MRAEDFEGIRSLILDLFDTMYASPGVGLAAPQIGTSLRVSVIDTSRDKRKRAPDGNSLTLINPILLSGSGEQYPREGCLSIPDFLGTVRRYESVIVRTLTLDGKERIIRAHGFQALALQHEIDHLDGKLFLDRITNLKTDLFRRTAKR